MPQYVALLRGIGPGNPNMRDDKLRDVFESLGFTNVRTVISSGNVLFESSSRDQAKLEDIIEQALPARLGFTGTAIIRSKEQLQTLADSSPFEDAEHGKEHYLTVTFLKRPAPAGFVLPRPNIKGYGALDMHNNAVFCIVNLADSKTPNLMIWLERQFGKEITTRTWKTVQRILNKLEAARRS